MCLTSSSRYHPVMSSGDPTAVPSSNTTPPLPDRKASPSTKQTEVNEQSKTAPSPSPSLEATGEKASFVISNSDLNLHERSMGPSNSGSLENITPAVIRGEVTSLDAISFHEEEGEIGETMPRDARSAFQITDIRPNPDELDKSVNRNPMSIESLPVAKGESGGSDESITAVAQTSSSTEKQQPAESERLPATPSQANFTIGTDESSTVETPVEVVEDGGASHAGINSSPKTSDESTAGKLSPHPSTTTAPSGNGLSVQPNRFRRVNQYERGRWTVRDSLVTEEATRQKQQETNSEIGPSDTPLPPPKHLQQRSDSNSNDPVFSSQVLPPTTEDPMPLPGVVLLGGPPTLPGGGESTSDKDSSSVHMDRNSTAADTLSRNTSMSSIMAPEKSIDGDEILSEIDTENFGGGATTNPPGGHNPAPHEGGEGVADIPMVSTQPPIVPTSSTGSVPLPSASNTAMSRDELSGTPSSNPSGTVELQRIRRVDDAISMLQSELKQILTSSSSYPGMMEENKALKDQRTVMDQANLKLREELTQTKEELTSTKDELHATREENDRLSKELKELRSSLSALAKPSTSFLPSSATTATTSNAAISTAASAPTYSSVVQSQGSSSSAPAPATTTVPASRPSQTSVDNTPPISETTSSDLTTAPPFSPSLTPTPSTTTKDTTNVTPKDGT